jgi:uncharacterized cupredoxin-like copper-binding protein
MDQQEIDRLERRSRGDRRFFVRLFSFLAGLAVLGLIGVAYAVGFGNGKDEGRKAQTSTAETQAAQPPSTTPASASGGALQIAMSDDYFTPSAATAKAGNVTISNANNGQLVHEMVLAKTQTDPSKLPTTSDGSVDEAKLEAAGQDAGEIADVSPGATKTGKFKLTPGQYVMFCNVPGHYAAGMYGTITVK